MASIALVTACGQAGETPVPDATPAAQASPTATPSEALTAGDAESGEEAEAAEVEPQAAVETSVSTGEPEAAVETPEPLAGRIAYVTPDLKIRTVNPDGTEDRSLISTEGRYSWPTWAPDGKTIAFPAVRSEGDSVDVSLLAVRDGGLVESVLYRGDPEYAGILVAPNLPHYPVWSPDGERLALITGGEAGLEVFVDDLRDEAGPAHVASQAPVYFSWSHTSRYLLVHRGGNHVLVDTEPGIETRDLSPFAAGYRAPAWWPGAELMTTIERNDESGLYGVHLRSLDGETTFILRAGPRVAYLWSPDGKWLAVGRGADPRVPAYDEVVLVSPEGERHAATIDELVIAFAWSPDSSMLAYVTVTGAQLVWGWNVLEVETGRARRLAEFIASEDMRVWLQYFDQFVYSHGIWSPDSRAIVFAGAAAGGATGASTSAQQQDQVIVLTVGELPTLQALGEGRLAFWSPK